MNSDAMIHWIIIIVDRGKGNKVSQFFQKEQIPVMLMIPGHGTASSKMMDYLGLDEPNKDIQYGLCFGHFRYSGTAEPPNSVLPSRSWYCIYHTALRNQQSSFRPHHAKPSETRTQKGGFNNVKSIRTGNILL